MNCILARLNSSSARSRNIRFLVISISAPLPPITASEYALYLSWKFISTLLIKITLAEIFVNIARQVAIS